MAAARWRVRLRTLRVSTLTSLKLSTLTDSATRAAAAHVPYQQSVMETSKNTSPDSVRLHVHLVAPVEPTVGLDDLIEDADDVPVLPAEGPRGFDPRAVSSVVARRLPDR
jgi:hypothetical protein